MINLLIENPLKPGYRVLNRQSQCLAQVMQSQDRILALRDLDITWSHIAMMMKMSTSSLRKAIKQINAMNPEDEFSKPNALCSKLLLYFKDEESKKDFKKLARAIQKGEEQPDDE